MRIVCLCGSVRFKEEFLAAQELESLRGRVVLAPGVFAKADGIALSDDEVQRLHALHRRKIELADELVVIAPDGRIGETTSEEIAYGRSLGKPVRYWEPVGRQPPIDPSRMAQAQDRGDLARRVAESCRLEGQFTLRSGQTATTYFDKYLFEGDPAILGDVARAMASLIPSDTEVLAGLELGGVPVATALSLATGLPAAFVRKEAKTYGTAKLAEGAIVEGRRVLVVEDVITTGGQVVSSIEQLRGRGAVVSDVLCVIDRSEGDHSKLDDISVGVRSLFVSSDLDE